MLLIMVGGLVSPTRVSMYRDGSRDLTRVDIDMFLVMVVYLRGL